MARNIADISVRLIQTKWNGIVSQPGQMPIATKFAIAKAAQATSGHLRRREAIARMANGFDRRVRTELLAQPPNTDVDDVRVRVEVVAPDLGKQTLAADHLALVLEQVMKDAKFAIGQLGGDRTKARLAPREVQHECPCADDVAVFALFRPAQLHVDARDQLIEGERFAQIVRSAEPEAAKLSRQVRPRRDDHDR